VRERERGGQREERVRARERKEESECVQEIRRERERGREKGEDREILFKLFYVTAQLLRSSMTGGFLP
jgi:hypothetical protein